MSYSLCYEKEEEESEESIVNPEIGVLHGEVAPFLIPDKGLDSSVTEMRDKIEPILLYAISR